MNDPVKLAADKKKVDQSVYHTPMANYRALHMPQKRSLSKKEIAALLSHPSLNERQKNAAKPLTKRKYISNAIYQKLTGVSKPESKRDLQALATLEIFTPPATKGAGALYTLLG